MSRLTFTHWDFIGGVERSLWHDTAASGTARTHDDAGLGQRMKALVRSPCQETRGPQLKITHLVTYYCCAQLLTRVLTAHQSHNAPLQEVP